MSGKPRRRFPGGRRLPSAMVPALACWALLATRDACPAAPPRPEVHALVIGVSAYKVRLPGAAAAAQKVAQAIAKTYSSSQPNIRKLIDGDATLERVAKVLFDEFPQVPDNSLLIVYFAGHGMARSYRSNDREKHLSISDCHLLLSGATRDSYWGKSLRVDDIVASIRRSGRCNWMVLLDCCHSSPGESNLYEFSDDEAKKLGVKAFMLAAAHQKQETYSGLFTDCLLEFWSQDSGSQNCLKPTDLADRVRAAVEKKTGDRLTTPSLVFGNDVGICISELNQPGFLLVCLPKREYGYPLYFEIDDSPPFVINRPATDIYRRHLNRKPHKFRVTCMDEVLYQTARLEPKDGEDVVVIELDKSTTYAAQADPVSWALALESTARTVEAYGRNPASHYYRASVEWVRAQPGSSPAGLLEKVYQFGATRPASVEYRVAAVALGKKSFTEVNGDLEVARELAAVGRYGPASEAFLTLARSPAAKTKDERARLLAAAITTRRATGQKVDGDTFQKWSTDAGLDAAQVASLNRLVRAAPAPQAGPGLVTPPPLLPQLDWHEATRFAWELEGVAAHRAVVPEFEKVIQGGFEKLTDKTAAFALALDAAGQYQRCGLISKRQAGTLVDIARRQWASELKVTDWSSGPLSEEEMRTIAWSNYYGHVVTSLNRAGFFDEDRRPPETLVAGLTLRPDPELGPEKGSISVGPDSAYRVKNRCELAVESPRNGFATIVWVDAERVKVYPQREEKPFDVPPRKKRVYDQPLPRPTGRTNVFVIVTPVPAATDRVRELANGLGPRGLQAPEGRQNLERELARQGLPWIALGDLVLEPAER